MTPAQKKAFVNDIFSTQAREDAIEKLLIHRFGKERTGFASTYAKLYYRMHGSAFRAAAAAEKYLA